MAVRADANGDELRISSGLPSNVNNFSVTFWVMRVGNGGGWSCLWDIDNGGTNDYIYLENNGSAGDNSYDLWTGVSDSNIITNAVTLTNGVWHFVGITKAGNTHTVYQAAVTAPTISSQNASQANAFTPGNIAFAESPWSNEWFNGRIAAMKFWDGVALSATQIASERYRIIPANYGNLYGFWPMFGGATERLRDYSGNGHNFTAGGTLTDEAGPPIAWGTAWVVVPPTTTGVETVSAAARGFANSRNDVGITAPSLSQSAYAASRTVNPTAPTLDLSQAGYSFGSVRNKIAIVATPVLATALGFSGARNLAALLLSKTATAYAPSGSRNDAAPLAVTLATARGFNQGIGIANYYGGTRAHRIFTDGQYWAALDSLTDGHYTANIAVVSSIARAYGGSLAIAVPSAVQFAIIAQGFGDTKNRAAPVASLTNIAYGASATRNLAAFLTNPTAAALGQSGAQNEALGTIALTAEALGQAGARNLTNLLVSTTLSAYGFSKSRARAVPITPGLSEAIGRSMGRGSFIAIPAIAVGASGQARAINVVAFSLDLTTVATGDSKGLGIALPSEIPSGTSAAAGQSRGRGSFISLTSLATGAIGQAGGLAGTLLSGIVYIVVGDYIILFPDTDIDVLLPDEDKDVLFPDDEINIIFG